MFSQMPFEQAVQILLETAGVAQKSGLMNLQEAAGVFTAVQTVGNHMKMQREEAQKAKTEAIAKAVAKPKTDTTPAAEPVVDEPVDAKAK